jgi:hypothetical protein
MKKTAEQLMESLLAMLTREARTDEDQARLESMRQSGHLFESNGSGRSCAFCC